jgi:hypothetical protein
MTGITGARVVIRKIWILGLCVAATSLALACTPAPAPPTAHPATVRLRVSGVTDVSRGCAGQNAEVETATALPRYVYDLWIGCAGIGFARSTDGGLHFGPAVRVPGSRGPSWDPAIAVAPDGTVYAAYMHASHNFMYPVVAASFDHGASFPRVVPLIPHVKGNWGDRDFIAVGRTGDVYLTWDYGPSAAAVKLVCGKTQSCGFGAGEVNAVIQKSTDGGRTWGPITPVGPGFPRNGGIGAPLLVQPGGRIDVLYLGHYVSPGTYQLHAGHEFFTSSADGTRWPSHPLELWPGSGAISPREWWIDVNLATDAGGNLYATWDTQTSRRDVGWLSVSTDGGKTWGRPVRVTPGRPARPGRGHAVHILASAGGPRGVAYIGWQTDAPAAGYATYLRAYSVTKGWLGPAVKVSPTYGRRAIWPGDTFGLATLPDGKIAVSWGSAVGAGKDSEIWAATVSVARGG